MIGHDDGEHNIGKREIKSGKQRGIIMPQLNYLPMDPIYKDVGIE